MVDYDDKRNFYRMLLNSEVVITVIDDEANSKILATCRDLSATGMAVEMSHPLEMGTEVRMRIDSMNNNVQAFDASGKVVRVLEEGAECYLIGITIQDLD
ncbi:MAG: PilZ domain-containing protein [Gammaproteobacteria bacterium]|nr:MAG: PilZ domain-containing protein [Gammaproteobacteria bacterium]